MNLYRQKQIWLFLIFSCSIVPLLFEKLTSFAPFEFIKLETMGYAVAIFLGLGLIAKPKRFFQFELNFWVIGIFAFIISMFISAVLAESKYAAFVGNDQLPTGSFISYAIITLSSLIIGNLFLEDQVERKKLVRRIAYLVILSGFFVSTYGIIQRLGLDPFDWFGYSEFHLRVFGSIGNPIQFGMFCSAIAMLTLYELMRSDQSNINTAGLLTAWTTMTVAVFLSGSRGPIFLSILCFTFSIFILIILKTELRTSLRRIFLTCLIVSLCSFVFLRSNQTDGHADRISKQGLSSGLKVRTVVWETGLQIGFQNPFFGAGPEHFTYIFHKNRPAWHNELQTWNQLMTKAHNELVQLWVTQGLFGILAFLFICFAILQRGFILLKYRSEHPENTLLILGVGVSIVNLFCNNLLVFNVFPTLWLSYLLPTLLFLLPCRHLWRFTFQLNLAKPLIGPTIRYSLLVLVIAFIFQFFQFSMGNRSFAQAELFRQKHLYAEAIESTALALDYNPLKTSAGCTGLNLVTQYLAKEPNANASFLKLKKTIIDFVAVCTNHDRELNYNNWYYAGMSLLAIAPKFPEIRPLVVHLFTRTLELYPTYPLPYVHLGYTYWKQGQSEKSIINFNKAIELKPDFLEGYLVQMEMLYATGRKDLIKDSITKLKSIDFSKSVYQQKDYYFDEMIKLSDQHSDRNTQLELILIKNQIFNSR